MAPNQLFSITDETAAGQTTNYEDDDDEGEDLIKSINTLLN